AHDHLDFHGDLESYGRAKALLFEPELLAGTAVLNVADPWTKRLAALARSGGNRVVSYGRGAQSGADYTTLDERIELSHSQLRVRGPDAERELLLPLPGDFQVDNALAALAVGRALGLSWDEVVRGLETCPPVPGRLERVG